MRNQTITAVAGVEAGHWTNDGATTGTTVILFPDGARAGHVILGSAAGTRELGALDPSHLAEEVHAFCLSGGSSFGLRAADGVLEILRKRGVGFATRHGPVPVVPSAVLFDLDSGQERPSAESGRSAAMKATLGPLAEGRVGVGAGARAVRFLKKSVPGGFGTWSQSCGDWTVGACAVVNAFGAVRDPESGEWIAGGPVPRRLEAIHSGFHENTTLAVTVTDGALDRSQTVIMARMASAGLARTLYPAFTPFDGDLVFAASTGKGDTIGPNELSRIGHLAASCLERSIVRAIMLTSGRTKPDQDLA